MQSIKQIEKSLKRNTDSCNHPPQNLDQLKRSFMESAKQQVHGFTVDENNRQIVTDMFNYFIGITGRFDTKKGLWIEGDVGSGKSTLMQVFSRWLISYGQGFSIHTCSHIVNKYAIHGDLDLYTYNEKGYKGAPARTCFDEFGRESIPANLYGQKLNVTQHIIHIRYGLWQTTGLKTFVTTNLNVDGLEALYDDYIRDRRAEMFNVVVMTGKSRRRK